VRNISPCLIAAGVLTIAMTLAVPNAEGGDEQTNEKFVKGKSRRAFVCSGRGTGSRFPMRSSIASPPRRPNFAQRHKWKLPASSEKGVTAALECTTPKQVSTTPTGRSLPDFRPAGERDVISPLN